MSKSTNKIIFYALALVAATLLMCSCGMKHRLYKVRYSTDLIGGDAAHVNIESREIGYSVGDTISTSGLHYQVIIDTL